MERIADTINFIDFLSENISKSDFDNLSEIIECSQHRITKIKNDPRCGDSDQLIRFAKLCKVQPYELIEKFHFALDNLTDAEVQFFKQSFDYSKRPPLKKAV